jgi:hypothetical protein
MSSPTSSSGPDPQRAGSGAHSGSRPASTDLPPSIDLRTTRAPDASDPSGPTGRGARGNAPGIKRRGSFLPVAALVVAVAALGLAGGAFLRAGSAGTPAAAVTVTTAPTVGASGSGSASGPSATSSDTGSESSSSSDDGSTPGESGVPLPTVGYTQAYQDKRLLLTPNSQSNCTRYVDLDGPAVLGSEEHADLTFHCQTGSSLSFPSVEVAQITSPTATPEDCAAAIQQAPSDQEITLSRQLVICTTTDGVSTPDQPARRKVVRIVVNSVEKDGTTDITVSSWFIPS